MNYTKYVCNWGKKNKIIYIIIIAEDDDEEDNYIIERSSNLQRPRTMSLSITINEKDEIILRKGINFIFYANIL